MKHPYLSFFLTLTFSLCISGCQLLKTSEDKPVKNSTSLFNLLDPDIKTEKQAFDKGEKELKEGRSENALFYFIKVLQFNPLNINALEHIAFIHVQNKNKELAVKVFNDILKIDDKNETANEYLGLYYFDLGQGIKAKQLLEKAAASNLSTWRVHNALGVIADLDQKYTDAIKHYQVALNKDSLNPMLFNNIGYSFYLSGDKPAAKNYFNQALKIDNNYHRAIYNLALIEVIENHYDSAVSLFNRIMPVYESYNNIGYICMINNKVEWAEKYLQMAIDQSPVYFLKANENIKLLREKKAH